MQRDPNTGEIKEFREVSLQSAGTDAKNSMSLNRAPAPPSESVRGNASYIPFWPASFPEPVTQSSNEELLDSGLLQKKKIYIKLIFFIITRGINNSARI